MQANKLSWTFFFCAILFLQLSEAQTAVQRSAGSSYFEYHKYLEKTKNKSFVRSYLELAKNSNIESGDINTCLENLFIGKNSDDLCYDAVKSLTTQPLNSSSREVVLSFIKKLRKFPSRYQRVYVEFEKGFAVTHPQLSQRFGTLPAKKESADSFSKLEMKAWKKIIQNKVMLSESLLLINGEIIANIDSWTPPLGVFQWALISNTHEPMIRISSFSQFAVESAQELKAFSNQTCERSENREIKTYGLKTAQIFYSSKCILEKNLLASKASNEHIGDIPMNTKIISPSSKKHWIFPALALLGLGLASQLKGKDVSITMPSF